MVLWKRALMARFFALEGGLPPYGGGEMAYTPSEGHSDGRPSMRTGTSEHRAQKY